jgi:hypothetical protein
MLDFAKILITESTDIDPSESLSGCNEICELCGLNTVLLGISVTLLRRAIL